jgi:hypothetical protein
MLNVLAERRHTDAKAGHMDCTKLKEGSVAHRDG